ncbi:MAG TPA: tetratricopeptide repeat protein, partial [Candidatus Polarisedimenticolia bacterium]|nr:tetratricopeptide repeat protein [Candidatus Polarisedimenticolia bacterium]
QAAYAAEELALGRQESGDPAGAAALFEEAEEDYRLAADRFPDVPGFASRTGNFLLDRDRPAEAIPYLRQGVALDFYDPLGHFFLGEALRRSGRDREAVEEYARAVRYNPRLAAAALWSEAGQEERRRLILEKTRDLLLAEGAAGETAPARARVLEHVESLLAGAPAGEKAPRRRIVLVHRLDAVPGRSRARHLFGRVGFPIENLPVAVLESDPAAEERRWSWVLQGLPVLIAGDLETDRTGAPARSDGRQGGRSSAPRHASAARTAAHERGSE